MKRTTSLARQSWLVFGRSLHAGLREPALAFVFPIAFPLLIIGLFSQVYARVADLPGFPAGSYLGWMAPAVVLMAAMFGAGHSALGLVRDLQTGFLDRLRLMPVRPAALLLGRLLFDMARVTVAGLAVLAVAVALGAPLRGGPLGIVAIAALLAGWTLGYAGLYYVVGLRARSPEALTALVPLFCRSRCCRPPMCPPACCPAGSAPPRLSTPTATWSTPSAPPWPAPCTPASSLSGWPRSPPRWSSPSWPPPGGSPASSTATDEPRNRRYHHVTASPQQQAWSSALRRSPGRCAPHAGHQTPSPPQAPARPRQGPAGWR
jgi:ABC-2 type transport system permease protein